MKYGKEITAELEGAGFFQSPGAYFVVDGQYGSTGKGLVAGMLAELFHDMVDRVTTNAGPNSGHTSYFGDEKIVLQQLPTFSVVARKMKSYIPTYINGGAVIDVDILNREATEYNLSPMIHPAAAVIDDADGDGEKAGLTEKIGSTGKGVGAALSRKVARSGHSVAQGSMRLREQMCELGQMPNIASDVVFCEVSQGYSLGINAGFYPYCTSRDCTVAQALNDAQMHPSDYRDSIMVVRTYPIRVAGNSGPHYHDQEEITWADLGQTPEITTVTKKVRRIFTWSNQQFRDAVRANRPGIIFINFMNYLPRDTHKEFVRNAIWLYRLEMGRAPKAVLLGMGATSDDILVWSEDMSDDAFIPF